MSDSQPRPIPNARVSARAIYQTIRRDGEEEMARPMGSLWWSGVAAGIAISTSVIAEGLLQTSLPDSPWREPLAAFGYCVGFVLVVLGRMQLFTENTITAVLPLMARTNREALACIARLWSVVFIANMCGTLVAATFTDVVGFATPEQLAAFHEVSRPLLDKNWLDTLLHGIPAGFFVAAMVWMLPNARGSEIGVIVIATYIIAIGGFAHVVVGSMEAFLLVLAGEIAIFDALWSCLLPALIGNVLGGTVLFSLLAYGQVRLELD
ncbi:formate/nitrite transporter family protein [uncultured Salinisphaera sp.]|uniref:formate/nitrite transporter family protein n=1 Tax=uncultured Salinisphaera sp. TaxID=359372 RepID=UPI0032B104F0